MPSRSKRAASEAIRQTGEGWRGWHTAPPPVGSCLSCRRSDPDDGDADPFGSRPRLRVDRQVGKNGANGDEPNRERRNEIEIKAQHHDIDGAMNGAVQYAEDDENPGGVYIHRIHLISHKEIKRERIENHRNLEQVLEIVRWVRDRRR